MRSLPFLRSPEDASVQLGPSFEMRSLEQSDQHSEAFSLQPITSDGTHDDDDDCFLPNLALLDRPAGEALAAYMASTVNRSEPSLEDTFAQVRAAAAQHRPVTRGSTKKSGASTPVSADAVPSAEVLPKRPSMQMKGKAPVEEAAPGLDIEALLRQKTKQPYNRRKQVNVEGVAAVAGVVSPSPKHGKEER